MPAPAEPSPQAMEAAPAYHETSPPVVKIEPAPRSMLVPEPVQPESTPEPAPPPMVIREPEPPVASEVTESRTTTGDVLLIDSIRSTPAIQTPRNGMTMSSVRQQFGNPISEGSGIGDPPITRWVYDGYTVYFEDQHTITSVIRR